MREDKATPDRRPGLWDIAEEVYAASPCADSALKLYVREVTERAVRLGGGAALAIAQLEEAGELIEQVIAALARKGA